MRGFGCKFLGIKPNCAKSVPNYHLDFRYLIDLFGAGDRDRTGDIQLGKLTFYH